MKNYKRIMAVLMAATMVTGSSLAALASGGDPTPEAPVTSGSSEGEGESEGHVERKVMNVTLPTVASGTTPFAYTMDPERLIKETGNKRFGEDVIFPAADADTGVYFNTGKKGGDGDDKDKIVYKNESSALKVINESSHAIELTVKAEADSADTDLPLVAADAYEDADDTSLYLGLIVGAKDAVQVKADEAATDTVTIAGTAGNFKLDYNTTSNKYEYRVLTLAEYQALDGNGSKEALEWQESSFKLEGGVTEGEIASTTTAPDLTVTWSWVDPTANAAPSITGTKEFTLKNNEAVEIEVSLGGGNLAATDVEKVTFELGGRTHELAKDTQWTFANGKITIAQASINEWVSNNFRAPIWHVVFNDTAGTSDDFELK